MEIIIKTGSLENMKMPIVLSENEKILDNKKQPCPHCHSPIKVINTRSDLSTWESVYWTNPLVASIPYDGDCCQTQICVKCLLDGIVDSKLDANSISKQTIKKFDNIPVFTEINTVLLKRDGWEPFGERCSYKKEGNILLYRAKKSDNGWTLNNQPIEFMEEILITKK